MLHKTKREPVVNPLTWSKLLLLFLGLSVLLSPKLTEAKVTTTDVAKLDAYFSSTQPITCYIHKAGSQKSSIGFYIYDTCDNVSQGNSGQEKYLFDGKAPNGKGDLLGIAVTDNGKTITLSINHRYYDASKNPTLGVLSDHQRDFKFIYQNSNPPSDAGNPDLYYAESNGDKVFKGIGLKYSENKWTGKINHPSDEYHNYLIDQLNTKIAFSLKSTSGASTPNTSTPGVSGAAGTGTTSPSTAATAPSASVSQTPVTVQPPTNATVGTGVKIPWSSNTSGQYTYAGYIKDLYNFALKLGALLATLMIVYAGYRYIFARGDDKALTDAKDIIMGAILGMILLYLVKIALPFFVSGTASNILI